MKIKDNFSKELKQNFSEVGEVQVDSDFVKNLPASKGNHAVINFLEAQLKKREKLADKGLRVLDE